VRLGGKRVLNTIGYPEFQYAASPVQIRQQLVDNNTVGQFLVSFDQSAQDAPFMKYNNAAQLVPALVKPRDGYQLDSPSALETGALPAVAWPTRTDFIPGWPKQALSIC